MIPFYTYKGSNLESFLGGFLEVFSVVWTPIPFLFAASFKVISYHIPDDAAFQWFISQEEGSSSARQLCGVENDNCVNDRNNMSSLLNTLIIERSSITFGRDSSSHPFSTISISSTTYQNTMIFTCRVMAHADTDQHWGHHLPANCLLWSASVSPGWRIPAL